ncbi:MAG: protein kinase [Ignavibacteriaceae bacterium]
MLQAVQFKKGDRVTLTSGIYYIEDEIGSGGFGTVFKAKRDNKDYAIKINRIWELLPDDREDLKRRIKLEYEISRSIHSEHIVHSLSYDEIDENPVLVMDYCDNGNLRKRIGKRFSDEELKKIIVQILCGLQILHSYDIIHRDIKPENILFKADTALLTDFGISANLKNRMTQRNIRGHALKIFATVSYSPPEQSQKNLSFKLTGPTNDIFSFGVILYEMITEGKLPFGDITDFNEDSEVVERRKTQGGWNTKVLKEYSTNPTWKKIIEKCLNPDPRMRFQSANEILDKLNAFRPSETNQYIRWKLCIFEGSDAGKEFNITNLSRFLNKRVLTIGRFDQSKSMINDIPIHEGTTNYLSLHHATLECIIKNGIPTWYIRDGQWYTKDGKKGWYLSKNGIKVNNASIDQFGIEIKPDDYIKIGRIILKVICE